MEARLGKFFRQAGENVSEAGKIFRQAGENGSEAGDVIADTGEPQNWAIFENDGGVGVMVTRLANGAMIGWELWSGLGERRMGFIRYQSGG
jgi:hypothetical protein